MNHMKPEIIKKYLLNGVLLLIPLSIWNIVFIDALPKGYSENAIWDNIPESLQMIENIFKLIVFTLPLFIIISLKTKLQKAGFSLYILGNFIYFSSWIMQVYFPESVWSTSVYGFMAPAYTIIIPFVGIGLIGQKVFFKIPHFSMVYIFLASIFVIFHSMHAYIVFKTL